MKAIFLDLDGTLIKTKSGQVFPVDIDDWYFVKGIKRKLRALFELNYKIIIISNQGGIELKYISKELFEKKISTICEELEKILGLPKNYIAYRYCEKMYSYYRKPNPGMAYEMALEYELNLAECIMVGDREEDRDFAINSGIGIFMWAEDFVTT